MKYYHHFNYNSEIELSIRIILESLNQLLFDISNDNETVRRFRFLCKMSYKYGMMKNAFEGDLVIESQNTFSLL